MVAATYDADMQNSRADLFRGLFNETTSRLYGIANYRGSSRSIRTDMPSPGFLRAPFEQPASFAFESAVDELAHHLRAAGELAAARLAGPEVGQHALLDRAMLLHGLGPQ